MNYNIKDLKLALEFGRDNQNATIEDYLNFKSKTITTDELKEYNNVKYFKFKILDFEGFVFVDYSYNIHRFINKFVGNEEYYSFFPKPGDPVYYSIVIFDKKFGNLTNWKNYKDFKSLKCLESDNFNIKFILRNYSDDIDEYENDRINNLIRSIENEYTPFWNPYGNGIDAFIKEFKNDELQPINNLFKKI